MIRKLLFLGIACSLILSGCKKDDDAEPTTNNTSTAPEDFPTSLSGTTANMEFTTANAGAPYTLNQKANFTWTSNGDMGVDSDPAASNGDELTLPFDQKQNNEYWWKDQTNGHTYSLSFKTNGDINEINVFTTSNLNFLGQFTPIDTSQQINLVGQYAGTYSVDNVEKGSHTRMTVTIDSDGNIDFDTGVMLNEADFELVSDQLECCDGIWVDMKPYPSEPYPRIQLYVDLATGIMNKFEYYPEYPNVGGRVFVDVTKQ